MEGTPHVRLVVDDVMGREVGRLVDQYRNLIIAG